MIEVPIEVSARHIHLSEKDLKLLFGKDKLEIEKKLSQGKDFLAKEKLEIRNGERKISNVSIIGPPREKTQVELSETDFIFLKLRYALRDSGDLKKTPGIELIKNGKSIKIKEGVINTIRHIHCNSKKAEEIGLKDKQFVSVRTKGKASVTFHNVRVRVSDEFGFFLHLDTDEGNAACIPKKGKGIIINEKDNHYNKK